MTDKETSEDVAAIAARGLKNPKSLTAAEVQTLAGSALAQVEPEVPGLAIREKWVRLSNEYERARGTEFKDVAALSAAAWDFFQTVGDAEEAQEKAT